MTRVMKLRLKLSDFIGTDLESVIMNKIKQIENDLNPGRAEGHNPAISSTETAWG